MRKGWLFSVGAAAVVLANSALASAAPIVPQYDVFGALPQATFGGSGIPNTSVAITNVDYQGGEIVLGLSAAQRFANPVVTDDGMGTFFATAGPDLLNAQPTYAMWNFNAFYSYNGTAPVTLELYYDFDPGAGTEFSDHGRVVFSPAPPLAQSSNNLGFAFLGASFPPFVFPPSYPSFDPSATGEYTFALIARDAAGAEIGRSAIRVNAAPEPATLALIGIGALGLAAVRRQRG